MGVEVAAVLAAAMDQDVVAVEHRVVAASQHPAAPGGVEPRPAGRDDVEALVGAAAGARRSEAPDRPRGRRAGRAPGRRGHGRRSRRRASGCVPGARPGPGSARREPPLRSPSCPPRAGGGARAPTPRRTNRRTARRPRRWTIRTSRSTGAIRIEGEADPNRCPGEVGMMRPSRPRDKPEMRSPGIGGAPRSKEEQPEAASRHNAQNDADPERRRFHGNLFPPAPRRCGRGAGGNLKQTSSHLGQGDADAGAAACPSYIPHAAGGAEQSPRYFSGARSRGRRGCTPSPPPRS